MRQGIRTSLWSWPYGGSDRVNARAGTRHADYPLTVTAQTAGGLSCGAWWGSGLAHVGPSPAWFNRCSATDDARCSVLSPRRWMSEVEFARRCGPGHGRWSSTGHLIRASPVALCGVVWCLRRAATEAFSGQRHEGVKPCLMMVGIARRRLRLSSSRTWYGSRRRKMDFLRSARQRALPSAVQGASNSGTFACANKVLTPSWCRTLRQEGAGRPPTAIRPVSRCSAQAMMARD